MKKLSILFFLFILLTYSSDSKKPAEPIYIVPAEDGYNIYSYDHELLLEYHSKNLDSAGLDLLKDIYETAVEYQEHPEYYKEEKPPEPEREGTKKAGLFY